MWRSLEVTSRQIISNIDEMVSKHGTTEMCIWIKRKAQDRAALMVRKHFVLHWIDRDDFYVWESYVHFKMRSINLIFIARYGCIFFPPSIFILNCFHFKEKKILILCESGLCCAIKVLFLTIFQKLTEFYFLFQGCQMYWIWVYTSRNFRQHSSSIKFKINLEFLNLLKFLIKYIQTKCL